MKLTILTLLLLLSFSIFAQDSDTRINEYDQQLIEYYKNHYDRKIQLAAYLQSRKNTDIDKLKLILSNVLRLDSDKYSLYLVDNICHSVKEITDWCHIMDIHGIRYRVDPKNLNSYLSNLDELESESEKTALLEIASKTSDYNDSFQFYYVLETAKQIDIFNFQNKKLYEASLEHDSQRSKRYLDKTQKDIENSYLFMNEYTVEEIELELSKSASVIMAIGIDMAISMPYLRTVYDNCKKIENASACLHIAELQIHSKSLIDQIFGPAIKVMALKALNKDDSIVNEAELQQQRFRDSQSCYLKTQDIYLAMSLGQHFSRPYINDLIEHGDFIAVKNLALKIHKIQVDNGLVSDFDPNDCES